MFLCLVLRSIYPGGHGQYSRLSGCGLLRLHSTYRHDLKIYASDEGRVQMTAAAFAKVKLQVESCTRLALLKLSFFKGVWNWQSCTKHQVWFL